MTGGASGQRGPAALRAATVDDAEAVDAVFTAAARAAWSGFLGAERLGGMGSSALAWVARIEAAAPGDVVVAELGGAVVGFTSLREGVDDDLAPGTGEVATLYTDPSVWGRGVGRQLLDHDLAVFEARGWTEAVLWTEERNEQPRRVYERAGWALDGAHRHRPFLGAGLRELRYRRTVL